MMFRLTVFAALAAASVAAAPEWVDKSNRNTQLLLDVTARFSPEGAGNLGIDGLDDRISDPSRQQQERMLAATRGALDELRRRLKSETDPLVRQDLEILIDAAARSIAETEMERKLKLPYFNPARTVFGGIRALLDDQIKPERRKAALVRLNRYAGMEQGYKPIATAAEERIRERLKDKKLIAPYKGEVEENLAQSAFFLDGIGQLFAKYQIAGYQDSLATLKRQVAAYEDFVRQEILPRARATFQEHPDLYAAALRGYGVDIPAAALAKTARAAFAELQAEMKPLAEKLARERGWAFTDYRKVIAELKKEQIAGEAILPHYRERLKQVEAIARERKLVSLPARDACIRLASPAETAASPAPNMRPPRLLGNTGEMGEFVLPMNVPGKAGEQALRYDDFTFAAASWSLAAHELRPGHEMQFAKMVERGVSNARAIFAFNSTNVEGWGLYSEAIVLPYMPLEGQLVSLSFRLLRAARAFLDPELQMGTVTLEEARRILEVDVVCSKAMAKQETDRYTFRAPGQATSYFHGYVRLMELRKEIESKLGPKFEAMRFHDFVLDQGLLPPGLLRKAALAEFGLR